jgi:hypothetical protein
MKTLTELAFKCDSIYAMVADVKTLYECTEVYHIESYELDDSRIKPFYLVDDDRWKIKLPAIDEDDVKNFAAGARKIFNNGKLVHYDYMYHLDRSFFCPLTLAEEVKIQESGDYVMI